MVEKMFDSLEKMQQKSVFIFGLNYSCQVADTMILYESSFFSSNEMDMGRKYILTGES